MPRAVLQWWHIVVSHLGLALIVALGLAAWWGWHRPPVTVPVVSKEVQQVPVGGTRPIIVTVPGIPGSIPQVVTAPAPEVRIITTPQTVTVTPSQQAAAEAKAPVVITVPLIRDCVHPDVQGPPDPTCGKPVDPSLTLVQSRSGGYVRLAGPSDTMQTGPVETRVNGVRPVARTPWEIRVAAGASTLFSGSPYLRGEIDYHPFPRFDAVYVGAGVQRFFSSPSVTNGYLEVGATIRF